MTNGREWRLYYQQASSTATESYPLEQRVSDRVNQAYGLTPEDIDLMWCTAPNADSTECSTDK